MLINPAGGNEPIILGARVGLALNNQLILQGMDPLFIIIPISSDRQRDVLQDELTGLAGTDKILLDTQGGALLQDVVRSQANFTEHLQVLHTKYASLQDALNKRFGRRATQALDLTDLSGQAVTVRPGSIVGSFDTGGRIAIDTPLRHFAFPVLMSELVRAAREAQLPYDPMLMKSVEERTQAGDIGYKRRFLPLVHTLVAPALSGDNRAPMKQAFAELIAQPKVTAAGELTFTPPLKDVVPPTTFKEVSAPGIYTMLTGYTLFKGTAQGVVDVLKVITKAAQKAGLQVYTNPWAEEAEGVLRVSPKVLADPRIKAVVSRAGWGTGWQMLNAGKPWLVIPTQEGGDPEILFNNIVIDQLGIGAIIDPFAFSAHDLEEDLAQYQPRVQELRDLTTAHFGTSDGIEFVARHLAEDYKTSL